MSEVITKEVMETYKEMVIKWRKQTKHAYPWPNDYDCIRFALTELGEALDAEMRENKGYKRNNVKNHGVNDELGDALFMLFSIDGYTPGNIPVIKTNKNVVMAMMYLSIIAGSWESVEATQDEWDSAMDVVVAYILGNKGFSFDNLKNTIKKLEGKHLTTD